MHYYIYHIQKSLEFFIKLINCTHYIFINIINDFKIANSSINAALCNHYIRHNSNI